MFNRLFVPSTKWSLSLEQYPFREITTQKNPFPFPSLSFTFFFPFPSYILLVSPSPLAYLQTQNLKQPHLALDRLTAVNLLGTKLILPLHRLLNTWPTMMSVNTSQEVRWMSNDALSKAECFWDEAEKTLSKYERMETKKKPPQKWENNIQNCHGNIKTQEVSKHYINTVSCSQHQELCLEKSRWDKYTVRLQEKIFPVFTNFSLLKQKTKLSITKGEKHSKRKKYLGNEPHALGKRVNHGNLYTWCYENVTFLPWCLLQSYKGMDEFQFKISIWFIHMYQLWYNPESSQVPINWWSSLTTLCDMTQLVNGRRAR